MKLEILGTGCPKCRQLYENVQRALKNAKVQADVVKIEDIERISEYGVLITPALVVDGKVKAAGRVLSVQEIEEIIG